MAATESAVSEVDIIVRVQIDMAGLEGLERMKVDNMKPQVNHFVLPVGVPASRPTFEFASRHWPFRTSVTIFLSLRWS